MEEVRQASEIGLAAYKQGRAFTMQEEQQVKFSKK